MKRKVIVEIDDVGNVTSPNDNMYIGVYTLNALEEYKDQSQNNVILKEIIELVKEVKK